MMDQTIKADGGKVRPLLTPPSLVMAVANVSEYGRKKYGEGETWREVEVARYRNALYRHWLAYLDGEQYDPESGMPHMWHVAWNASAIIELEEKPRW